MEYNFYIPKELEGISPLIWEHKTSIPTKYMMLPEFNIDLVFNLDAPWSIHSDYYADRTYNPTENFCFLSGLHTRPLLVEFESCHLFGIRLNTIAASLLFGVDCHELKNWSVNGDDVLGSTIHHMQEHVMSLADFSSRSRWLELFICSLISQDSNLSMAIHISNVMDNLSDRKFAGNAVSIEDHTGYSRMHTLRIFRKWFGLPPGEALSLRRFEKSLNLIHSSNDKLTDIGLNSGFYDQSHFVREFKKFTALTPMQYSKLRSEKVGHFSI